MNKEVKLEKNIEKIILILLFFFAISLFNLAGYILAGIFLLYFFITLRGKYYIDKKTIVLFLFAVSYFFIYALHWSIGIKEIIIFLIAPWASYFMGKEIIENSEENAMIDRITMVMLAGFFLHGVLNLIAYLVVFGMDSPYRVTIDFWRSEILSVTGCSLYYVPFMSFGIGYIFFGNSKKLKICSFLAVVVGMFANIIYSNRTAVYLVGILIIIATGGLLFHKKAKLSSWINFIAVLFGIALVWIINLGGIQNIIMDLNITRRILGSDVGRFEVWKDFLTNEWIKYPFGGEQFTLKYGYAHNLWLDTIYSVGFIPFLLLLVFTIMALFMIKKFCSIHQNGKIYTFLFLGVFISFMVEPILVANPYYFIMMLFIIGGMQGFIKGKVK